MIKIFTLFTILFFGLLGSISAQTQGILPIADAVKGENLSKPPTIGFIGSRCGTLFMSIAGYFEGNANKESDKKIAADFMTRAQVFSFVGIFVDSNQNKKTSEAIRAQGDALSKAYVDEMLAGKRLNNNVFTKLIESDVNFCAAQFPRYLAYFNEINKSMDKK